MNIGAGVYVEGSYRMVGEREIRFPIKRSAGCVDVDVPGCASVRGTAGSQRQRRTAIGGGESVYLRKAVQ